MKVCWGDIGLLIKVIISISILICIIYFVPIIDWHYICNDDSMILTHVSFYQLANNKTEEGCKGFAGLDIMGQINYLDKNDTRTINHK
jgi:hypothetical protein